MKVRFDNDLEGRLVGVEDQDKCVYLKLLKKIEELEYELKNVKENRDMWRKEFRSLDREWKHWCKEWDERLAEYKIEGVNTEEKLLVLLKRLQ